MPMLARRAAQDDSSSRSTPVRPVSGSRRVGDCTRLPAQSPSEASERQGRCRRGAESSTIVGISVIPRPAATRPCLPSHCVDSMTIFGSKPAIAAALRSAVATVLPRPSIQVSSCRSASSRSGLSASGCERDIATYSGSSISGSTSSSSLSSPSESDTTATSSSPEHSIVASSGERASTRLRQHLVMDAIELGHRQGDQRRVGGRERADPQPAAVEPRQRLELMLGGGEPVEDHIGVLDQQLARRGQADAARAALDQPGPGFRLERRDLA